MTSFGESHGSAMGVVVDGCPAGVPFDPNLLDLQLRRRRPGASAWVSARNESDQVRILSGVYEGKTLGTPLAMITENTDMREQDYAQLPSRPGHADDVWGDKFLHRDPRGGGRASGRETVSRVMAGAVAEMFVRHTLGGGLSRDPVEGLVGFGGEDLGGGREGGLQVSGYVSQVGPIVLTGKEREQARGLSREQIDGFVGRLPSPERGAELENLLLAAKKTGESYGGALELVLRGVPRGLGEPIFHKLKADLATAMLSVGACVGFEFGAGFAAAGECGRAFHDPGPAEAQGVYGGIRGGISTGEPIFLRLAFKPTSSLGLVAQQGRHDPCIVPRAVPVCEAMAWLVLADHLLAQRLAHS